MGDPANQEEQPLKPGDVLGGKYTVVREIGSGAMGVIYVCRHASLNRHFAVKALRQSFSQDPEVSARFEQEAQAASAIGHPNIVDVFDLGRTASGSLYMVMELLDGRSLAKVMEAEGQMAVERACTLMVQCLSALAAAHKNGIVHRDIKPENIFVIETEDRPSFVKLVDFGISKVSGGSGNVKATTVGAIMGTPQYMSPEQATGEVDKIDGRTDVYAAGVVLYEMLCGQPPFDGPNYYAVMAAIIQGTYASPQSLRPDLPPALARLIARAMAGPRDERFPTAVEMRDALIQASGMNVTGSHQAVPSRPNIKPVPALPVFSESLDGVRINDLPNVAPAGKGPKVIDPNARTAPAASDAGTLPPSQPAPRPQAAAGVTKPRPATPHPDKTKVLPDSAFEAPGGPAEKEAALDVMLPAAPRHSRERHNVPTPLSQQRPVPRPTRSGGMGGWIVGAVVVAGLGVAGFMLYQKKKSHSNSAAPPPVALSADRIKLELVVTPPGARMWIAGQELREPSSDLIPNIDYALDLSAPGFLSLHRVVNIASPQTLTLRLPHALPPIGPRDPAASPAELADPKGDPPGLAIIDAALDHVARARHCLELVSEEGHRGREMGGKGAVPTLPAEAVATCHQDLAAATNHPQSLPDLDAAFTAYVSLLDQLAPLTVAGAQGRERLPALYGQFSSADSALREALLAAESVWARAEATALEQGGGSYHLAARRWALLARLWLRSPSGEHKERLARLNAASEVLSKAGKGATGVTGAPAFDAAARELAELAEKGPAGRNKQAQADATRAYAKVVEAFNHLVLTAD